MDASKVKSLKLDELAYYSEQMVSIKRNFKLQVSNQKFKFLTLTKDRKSMLIAIINILNI